MADLRRQLHNARAERDRAVRELEDHRAIHGWIDPEYAAALRDHAALALTGIRRESTGPISDTPDSRPPNYEARAYDDLRKQRVWQRKEAAKLRRRLRHLVDRDTDPDDETGPQLVPSTRNPQTRMVAQDSTSVVPIGYAFKRSLRSAPWNGQPLPQATTTELEAGLAVAPTAQTLRAGFTEGQAP